MPASTTVKVSRETRDRLAAIAERGETMEATIVKLLDSYQSVRARKRQAWEARLTRANDNPGAVEWGEKQADHLAKLLDERQASRR
ncbi:MAG: hypothetical protein JO100_00175 [Pseudonocardia sp.]|nr:hypothetical protein [Pseudonocardia sp.]